MDDRVRDEGTNFILRINPLNAELNPICHMLVLLGPYHIFYVSGLRVKEQETRLTLHEHYDDDDDDDEVSVRVMLCFLWQ